MLSDYARAVEALEQWGIRVDVRVEGESYLEESGQFLRQDCTLLLTDSVGRVGTQPSMFTIVDGKLDYSFLAYQLECLGDMLRREQPILEKIISRSQLNGCEIMPDKGAFLWE